jgi:hypothetical protein
LSLKIRRPASAESINMAEPINATLRRTDQRDNSGSPINATQYGGADQRDNVPAEAIIWLPPQASQGHEQAFGAQASD